MEKEINPFLFVPHYGPDGKPVELPRSQKPDAPHDSDSAPKHFVDPELAKDV